MQTHILGLPRIGKQRELKKALEGFWKGMLSEEQLRSVADELKKEHWAIQDEAGLSCVAVGDFSFYDHVLDTTVALGFVPSRFRNIESLLETYFAMARGDGRRSIPAMGMRKWFNTNYHYIVPEFSPNQKFRPSIEPLLKDIASAIRLGYRPKPILLGPMTWLALGAELTDSSRWQVLSELTEIYADFLRKLAPLCGWIQIDEPVLCMDMVQPLRDSFVAVYRRLRKEAPDARTLLTTYFGRVGDNLAVALASECSGRHLELCAAPDQLDEAILALPGHMSLSLGIVNGRNIWKTNYATALSVLRNASDSLGNDRLLVGSSCSLLHVPVDLKQERNLDPEIRSWMAFAVQKCDEIALLGKTLDGEWRTEELNKNRLAMESRCSHAKTFDAAVRERCKGISPESLQRKSSYEERCRRQQEILNLPLFPTTTIGSYPQTEVIRKARLDYRSGALSEEGYEAFLRNEIRDIIEQQEKLGLDVLVHGEPERTDMVEYFGQQLEGFCFTEFGWVQSYGSRCVKPPVLFGDVSRKCPMTVFWLSYAQSLTSKPVKGMLTGPVTILCWSFVRDDLERRDICRQIALALNDEVLDLERAGLNIIQIDEAALREGLPLRKGEADAYLEWAIEGFRLTVAGVRDTTQIHTHMCYSEFNSIISWIAAMDADVISIEASRSGMSLLRAFTKFRYPSAIGPGVYDIHSPRVPDTEEMLTRLKQALRFIAPERLWINPDCGLKTRAWPEVLASLDNMVRAARILREHVPYLEPHFKGMEVMNDTLSGAIQKTGAPYRYDIVGSFLRPAALRDARERFSRGRLTARELRQVEDAEIAGLIRKQKALGLHAVTDGEFRRSWWHLDFLWNLEGVRKVAADQGSIAFKDRQTRAETIEIVSEIHFGNHPFIEDFKSAQALAQGTQVKFTIPSPSMLHLITTVRNPNYRPIEQYEESGQLLDAIAAVYRKAVAAFYAAGCRYLQFDDTSWGEFCSEEKRAIYQKRGFDLDRLAEDYVHMINKAIEDRPADMIVTMHICRGNFRSTWFSSGGYEPVAEVLFGNAGVDGFFLEYDSDRAGDFRPLRFIRNQQVVLGLVSSKTGQLEDRRTVIDRIREATGYVPINQLCLSPQCGFASTEEGNLLTEEEQWAKIAFIRDIAEEVWK